MTNIHTLLLQIVTSDDFEWTRQLRYNYDDIRDTCMIRQNNSVFEYGFEYLGSTSRLVITPLTGKRSRRQYQYDDIPAHN